MLVFYRIINVKKSFLADFGGQMATSFVCRFGPCRLIPTPLSLLGRWAINSAQPALAPHRQLWLLIVWHASTHPAFPRMLHPPGSGTLFFCKLRFFGSRHRSRSIPRGDRRLPAGEHRPVLAHGSIEMFPAWVLGGLRFSSGRVCDPTYRHNWNSHPS